MKTPASITGILGQFLAMLWLAGSVSAESSPTESISKANPTPTSPKVATTNQNLVCNSMPAVTTPKLSPWTKEIVKLAQSGIEEGVMVAFIENSGTFELGADQIVYLNDLGIPGSVIGAMLQHDRELLLGERYLTIVSAPPYEPLFPLKPTAADKTAGETIKPPFSSPPPASGQTVVASPAAVQSQQATVPDSLELTSTFTSYPDSQSSEKKRQLYPVREPHAVELLPPIHFLNMAQITPNTLIVYGFPKP